MCKVVFNVRELLRRDDMVRYEVNEIEVGGKNDGGNRQCLAGVSDGDSN